MSVLGDSTLAPFLEQPQLVIMQQSSHIFFLINIVHYSTSLGLALQFLSNAPKNQTKAWKSHLNAFAGSVPAV